jgi:hypothetical protein
MLHVRAFLRRRQGEAWTHLHRVVAETEQLRAA